MYEYAPWATDVLKRILSISSKSLPILDLQFGGACNLNCIYCDTPKYKYPCLLDLEAIEKIISNGNIQWGYACCNPSENEKKFRRDCKERNIRNKVVERGSGCKHCTGPYTYRWIETDSPNYDMYILYLEQRESVDVFFYSEDERTTFLEELAIKIPFKIINTFHPNWYYGMKDLYGVKMIMP